MLAAERAPHAVGPCSLCPGAQKRIVNRLNKIKVGRIVDYEAEQIERVKRENAGKVSPRLPRYVLQGTSFNATLQSAAKR